MKEKTKLIFRIDKIVELCEEKEVLHLGFIQHSHLYEELIKKEKWLHKKIDSVAKRLVGFDYLKEEVESVRKKYNYDCYYADVMKLDEVTLENKFDIIVCGELIEHIENPGLMLDGIKRFMHDKSKLIITTPNPWSQERIKLIQKSILEDKWLNGEHVGWYSYQILKQLLERKGFNEILYDYYYGQTYEVINLSNRIKRRIFKLYNGEFVRPKKQCFDGLFFITKLL